MRCVDIKHLGSLKNLVEFMEYFQQSLYQHHQPSPYYSKTPENVDCVPVLQYITFWKTALRLHYGDFAKISADLQKSRLTSEDWEWSEALCGIFYVESYISCISQRKRSFYEIHSLFGSGLLEPSCPFNIPFKQNRMLHIASVVKSQYRMRYSSWQASQPKDVMRFSTSFLRSAAILNKLKATEWSMKWYGWYTSGNPRSV